MTSCVDKGHLARCFLATALKLAAGENGFKILCAQRGVAAFGGITNHVFAHLKLIKNTKFK